MKAMSEAARRDWLRVKERYEAGDRRITSAVRRMAEEALGVTFVRTGKAQRPDAADRRAGDRSFDDDGGMVVL